MVTKILKYSEIIQYQATVNIGSIGHVSEGKSTLVASITGIKTQKHKKEQERNITIHLGYANGKIWWDEDTEEIFYTPSNIFSYKNKTSGNECILIKHFSFVDCPGHESFMSTMISGTSVMDCTFLVIGANNTVVPQQQTYEHLIAINNTDIENILVLQNKIDLLKSKKDAESNKEKIEDFLEGSIAENSPIIPISAQLGINIDEVCKYIVEDLAPIKRNLNESLRIVIIRTFDVNKPKTDYNNLLGGVIGGSIKQGVLELGQYLEIRPGILKNDEFGKLCCYPIITKIESIQCEKNNLEIAVPGGLLGIRTSMDPYFCGSNRLVGQVAGEIGNMSEIYIRLEAKIKRIRRRDLKKESYKNNEKVIVCINSTHTNAYIKLTKDKYILQLILEKPICADIGDKFAIMKRIGSKFTLYSFGEIKKGERFDNIKYHEDISKLKSDKTLYKIEYDSPYKKEKYIDKYDELIENFNFNDRKKSSISLEPIKLSRKSRQTIVTNMYKILASLHNLEDKLFDYRNNFIKFFNTEINKMCRFNDSGEFIMDGKFQINNIENLLKNYIKKYVCCPICFSSNTKIRRFDRLVKICCNSCTAENSL